ncbi:dihydrofolate reductase family protein [Nocardioides sp. HDW12B]|uniref:dihydrofolate reductase family protein n=1 Tax=Nocardioides sp. HDW12B TaxID=2714939 RepID=UPI001F0DD350|nr:dihydrofolate reductase family protein [Nocardioides sp. HDW12B]
MILGPVHGPVATEDLPEHYPWPERDGRPWVRAMMSCTLDGAAAGADGLSGSISSDADGAVFSAVRRFADVVLVGGGTLAAEEYGPSKASEEDAARRAAAGQAPAPVIAVVSGSLKLPLDDDGFTASTVRPIVFTTADPDPDRLAAVRERCDVVQADGDTVDVGWVVERLAERGLWRIVCEGGPSLLRDAAAADLLDEADLTFAPLLVGSENTPRTDMLDDASRFELAHVLTEEGVLMTRYLRGGTR